MCGNVWEFVGGLRFLAGEVQIIPNNEAAAGADQSRDSKEWTPIYTVDGNAISYGCGAVPKETQNSNFHTGISENNIPIKEEIRIISSPSNEKVYINALFTDLNNSEIAAPYKLLQLGLYPSPDYEKKDRFYLHVDKNDERCVSRGGGWGNELYAGIFALNASNTRTDRYTNIGFRLAYVRYFEEATT